MTLRTLVGVVVASGLALALVEVGCNRSDTDPRPAPGADGGLGGTYSDGGTHPDDTGAYQDAPNTFPQDAGGSTGIADSGF